MGNRKAKRRRSPTHNHYRSRSPSPPPNPKFPSYLTTTQPLPPKLHYLCFLIASFTSSKTLETTLNKSRIFVTKPEVERILALSYGYAANAMAFFRWSGWQLNHTHTEKAWNLVVDLLGKNLMFDAMWDTVKAMESKGVASLVTFSSVFESYVSAGKEKDAISAFDVMDRYGIARNIKGLNSLLSALCKGGKTRVAVEFMRVGKEGIRPDGDTFGILLEGSEIEREVNLAKEVFEEMVGEVGWLMENVASHDSFLISLVKGEGGLDEAMSYFEVLKGRRCYPGVRFLKVALEECVKRWDVWVGLSLWETLVVKVGLKPDTKLYNLLMGLYCFRGGESALLLLDEMVRNGIFPDGETYNVLLKFFIRSPKLNEASLIFYEMRKNDFVPDQENCQAAIRVFLDAGDIYMGVVVWKCMLENYENDLEEIGNIMLVKLHDLDRLQEAAKFAGVMKDRGIKLNASVLLKLEESLCKLGKTFLCEKYFRKPET